MCNFRNELNIENLSIVNIANFCLLAEKYSEYVNENGVTINHEDNKMLLEECSESISNSLKIMDECQKMLYKTGYTKEHIKKNERNKKYVC